MPYQPGSVSAPRYRGATHRPTRRPRQTQKVAPRRKTRRPSTPREKRQRRNRVLFCLYVALAMELAAFVFSSPLLAIRRETISGITTLSVADTTLVEQSAAVRPGTNWVTASLSTVEQRLRRLPYVRYAVAKRVLPNAISVRIGVREPEVVAEINGLVYEVDHEGVPIRLATAESKSRLATVALKRAGPLKLGSPLHDGALISAMDIYAQWREATGARIGKIEVDQNDDICLNMQDGVTVALGQNDELTEKLARLRDIYKHGPDLGQKLAAINLTVPSAPAVTLRNVVPPASTTPEITGTNHPLDTL